MWHYHHGPRRGQAREALFWKGYRYLRKHAPWMRYEQYRRQGLPIGSGVTEAACKTVFAERLKRSGMTWGRGGGQVIVDLRILVLSGVWPQTHTAYLASRPQPTVVKPASYGQRQHPTYIPRMGGRGFSGIKFPLCVSGYSVRCGVHIEQPK